MTALTDFRAMLAAQPGAGTVTFGALSSPCLVDFEGHGWGQEGQAQVGVEEISLTYCYPDLPGLSVDDQLSVDGVAYVVRAGPRRKGDGLEGIALLESL